MISTEFFHSKIVDFDSWGAVKSLFKNATCQGSLENITLLKTGHILQTDVAVVDTWTTCVLFGLMPTKKLHAMMAPGTLDNPDELFSKYSLYPPNPTPSQVSSGEHMKEDRCWQSSTCSIRS